MKKYLPYILIIVISVGLFTRTFEAKAQTLPNCIYNEKGEATNASPNGCIRSSGVIHSGYQLLAPLPCENGTPGCINGKISNFEPGEEKALGTYLNLMIKIFLGLCAVLAVVMIVIGGIEYMTTELISSKEEGKKRILGAIWGLLLALGAYALLNTINPDLLKNDIEIPGVTVAVTLDQVNFTKTEQTVASAGKEYKMNGTFTNPFMSSGVSGFIDSHLKKGEPLTAIAIDTATKKAYFYVGNDFKTSVAIPINTGYGGVAEIGQAQSGDGKTPKGTTVISSDIRLPTPGNSVLSRDGKYNLGAGFINLGATTGGSNREIGFHGSANNTLGTTNGCIRMNNDDLVALAPYMKAGVQVIIK